MPKPTRIKTPQMTRKRLRSDHSMMRLIIKLFPAGELGIGVNQQVAVDDDLVALVEARTNFGVFIADAAQRDYFGRVKAGAFFHINHRTGTCLLYTSDA